MRRPNTLCVCSVGLVCVLFAAAIACDTPVYRYAMYRWTPKPFEIYYFHDRPVDDAVRERHDALGELPFETRSANVAVIEVDLADDAALARLPADVREAWTGEQRPVPGYLVYSPQGAQLFAGDLDADELATLTDSPARKELAEHLAAAKLGVLVVLQASEQVGDAATKQAATESNRRALQVARTLTEKVASGELQLYAAPNEPVGGERGDDGPPASKPKADAAGPPPIAVVAVDRDDPAERWLVRALLAVEPDLKAEEFRTQPMVFVAYGRARVLKPYIGLGVRVENVQRDIEFISGACSCTVQDQDPGVDLLTRFDWEGAAEAMADRFGSEEGNESQFGVGDLFPQLALPPAAADGGTEVAAAGDAAEPAGQVAALLPPLEDTRGETAPPFPFRVDPPSTVRVAALPPADAPAAGGEPKSGSPWTSVYAVGGGVGLALILLFGATLLVLRPR